MKALERLLKLQNGGKALVPWEEKKAAIDRMKAKTDLDLIQSYHKEKQPISSEDKGYSKYLIKKGDTLGAVARLLNTSVGMLASQNNITDVNKIYEGQTLSYKPGQSEDFKANYAVVDKVKGLMQVYKPNGELVKEYKVGVGEKPGDAQTVTKFIDRNGDGKITDKDKPFKPDWDLGNKSTGAGIYSISNKSQTGYHGSPILNLKNDSGMEVATSLHRGYGGGNSRVSNGCIRMSDGDLKNTLIDLDILKSNVLEMELVT